MCAKRSCAGAGASPAHTRGRRAGGSRRRPLCPVESGEAVGPRHANDRFSPSYFCYLQNFNFLTRTYSCCTSSAAVLCTHPSPPPRRKRAGAGRSQRCPDSRVSPKVGPHSPRPSGLALPTLPSRAPVGTRVSKADGEQSLALLRAFPCLVSIFLTCVSACASRPCNSLSRVSFETWPKALDEHPPPP